MSNELQKLTPEQQAEEDAVWEMMSGKMALQVIAKELKEHGIALPVRDVWKYAKRKHIEQAVHSTFALIGGIPRMVAWADANPGDFYKAYIKLGAADTQIAGLTQVVVNSNMGTSPLDVVSLDDNGKVVNSVTVAKVR